MTTSDSVRPMTVAEINAVIEGQSRLPRAIQARVRQMIRKSAISGQVTVGYNFWPSRGVKVFATHGLTIDHFVKIGPDTHIEVNGTIGSFCGISHHTCIVGRRDHDMSTVGVPVAATPWVGDRELNADDILTMGRDVYVGAGSTILSGVTIGDAAVIAAGSVITKDVPPFAVVAGTPGKVVGKRFKNPDDEKRHIDAIELTIQEIERLLAAGDL
ncbi:hypothetical protein IEU95_03560 [Hoyosella rhizosphaerae]|uniref:Acetyltransferase n=1 Tax=Hoyosella rhizosphaerae TaxID=1755582 RepID=A0A916XFM7_9ACTN|nr:DapH/DapD/GlmU-related protein [Hoyosella rhizosphaerae]MBN4925892.1 hypothetical protein [Hoyosella rhizosphaerae]GGC67140.1 hypothetical protein GCM10011410_19760 [Hoyosella rhizosphaerae]